MIFSLTSNLKKAEKNGSVQKNEGARIGSFQTVIPL